MKQLRVALFSAMALFFFSCEKVNGDGPVVTETRAQTGYQGIDMRMAGTVYFKRDSVYKVELSAQQNVLDEIQTYVSDDRLVIKLTNNVKLRSYEPLKVMVSGPTLNALRVSGSGDIITTSAFTSGSVDLNVSGSGSIKIIDLTADYLDGNISGSGNIEVQNGAIAEQRLKISGSGSINLSDVNSIKAKTTTSGSGDIRLNVSQELDVTISGSGSVYYKGNPSIDTRISGSGKVVRM
jgi:hypothetical protein